MSPKIYTMPVILTRSSLRYLLRHPWQIGLCILGVALGVAMIVAIDLANASAMRAFRLSTEAIAGRATHQIIGGPSELDESLYRRIRIDLGVRQAAPVVDGYVTTLTLNGITLHMLGVDPLAEAPFRSYLNRADTPGTSLDLTTLLVEPNTVLVSEQLAQQYGLTPGAPLTLQVGSQSRTVRIVDLLRPNDDLSRRALESMLISDIATAQEVLGKVGRLSRIDLILDTDEPVLAQLTAILPAGAELTRPAARVNTLEQMTRAFELNLSALSLLALIVGMFLIYNTMTFNVVQRRGLLGTLRCIGVTRRQIFALIMAEAVLISVIGTTLGLLLGIVLGRSLVTLVTRTINDLYFVVTVRSLTIDPAILLKGGMLGIGATLIAAAMPAREAMHTPPRLVLSRSSIEERVRRAVPLATWSGLAAILVGSGILIMPADFNQQTTAIALNIWLAFVALFVIVLGCAFLAPGATVGLMMLIRPIAGRIFGMIGRMAARDVVAALSRTSVAIAAMMIAVSVTIGVGIMVGSFRQTVVQWLEQSLMADIYIASPSNTANRIDTPLDLDLAERLAQTPGVAAQTRFRSVQTATDIGPVTLVAIDRAPGRQGGQRFVGDRISTARDLDRYWDAFDAGAVFISEPLSFRMNLHTGDRLRLRTDRGEQDFPIAGVYYDYTSDRGVIQLAYHTYRTYWDDPQISSLALYAEPGVHVDALVQTLRERGTGHELVINSNRGLRTETMAIFDRTFAITAVLQLLATIVAFIGILSALMALQLERARELGMLRANGLTPRQVWGIVLGQTGLMGLTAGLLAAPVGIVLALILVYVINRRSFGWTLELSLDPALFGQALLVAVVAALLAGIYPALRMSRTSPAMALREE